MIHSTIVFETFTTTAKTVSSVTGITTTTTTVFVKTLPVSGLLSAAMRGGGAKGVLGTILSYV